jgi:peptide chain release factor 1
MRKRLERSVARHEELGQLMSDPNVTGDRNRLREVGQEYAALEPVVATATSLANAERRRDEAQELIEGDDPDLRDLAREDHAAALTDIDRLGDQLRLALIPSDPLDDKSVIVEIRGGEGGEEAALFAADLYKMFARYAERQGWKLELLSQSLAEKGGFKEVVFRIQGRGAYSRLKFESGVHRVQRVPATEAQGRIHTSTATVAVLPEADELDVQINDDDLQIDLYRAGGHGGQGVNTTDSAVRITHLPTGIVVTNQDERSQLKNKTKAMAHLRARLLAHMEEQRDEAQGATRRAQIGRGERAEKMRTYNFPQDRLTDKRLGRNFSGLDRILNGEMDDLVQALREQDQADRLASLEDEVPPGESEEPA